MQSHHISVPKTARIFSTGEIETAENVLFVIHGYGQLANYFIRHFESLAAEKKICVIAPEGLSRFYMAGFNGKVGASWMTKEDREWEIQDQKVYLEQIYAHFFAQNPHAKFHLLGFSQGVATAWRWLCNGEAKFSSFTLWAGECPREFPESILNKLQKMDFYHVHALQDEFIPVAAAEAQYQFLKNHFPQIQSLHFDGKHTMNPELLAHIF